MPRKFTVERMREVLDALASGLNPCQVARVTGASESYARNVQRSVGGVFRPAGTAYSPRYLSRLERYELARLLEFGLSQRAIAARLGRSPSTICRELQRNRDSRSGQYQPDRAEWLAWERQRRPKPSKCSADAKLRHTVQQLLDRRYSPEQVAGRLPVLYPDNQAMRISPETIYQSLYVYPRGELKRELTACLRRGRRGRKRRGGPSDGRGSIVAAVPIGERPAEVEGRLVPGHHEGDLIKGTTASNSAVGTIVERQTGYLTLIPLPKGHRADQVADAIVEHMSLLPGWFTKTLTWDRGNELARHASITQRTGMKIYFADPYSPYQRGSNENTNGLLREYLPKGTDLSEHTPADLLAIQNELNDRPRKRLGFHTPREAVAKLLEQDLDGVARTP
jgi:IS30 family transposase